MTPLRRWAVFNAVGAAGMAVQLAALALFNRLLHGHYLIATAAALECTLLHNVVLHRRFTWRDRRTQRSAAQQVLRFHLTNGLLSFAVNLALMRLLVQAAHLPVVAANAVAIVCCSTINYCVANLWVFSRQRPTPASLLR